MRSGPARAVLMLALVGLLLWIVGVSPLLIVAVLILLALVARAA